MPSYTVTYALSVINRAQMRTDLISQFMMELPGNGNGDNATRYQYDVETLGNYGIFLKRPTQLNKGFDFTVNVSGLYFKKYRRYSNPSHQDIIDALTSCKEHFPQIYQDKIKPLIKDIYNCKQIDLSSLTGATFADYEQEQHPIEIILLAIKWLFMEQDCAYWNYSGRAMFFDALQRNNLV